MGTWGGRSKGAGGNGPVAGGGVGPCKGDRPGAGGPGARGSDRGVRGVLTEGQRQGLGCVWQWGGLAVI